ncbi:MAG: hypothetical protein PSV24_15755 [Rhodoferax sp.]|nr:hypothetical protein [Rhodoferax sp.]
MQRLIPGFLFLCALLAAFLIYQPGLGGPPVFDDGPNIVNNPHLRVTDLSLSSLREAAYSSPVGAFQRPISMLSFGMNFHFNSGNFAPFPFKLTNLFIHLLNGSAIFALVRLIVGHYRKQLQPLLPAAYPLWLALAVSAAWLLHPLNLTTVLYLVQRMNSLAVLFTLGGLFLYVWGRIRVCNGQRGGILAILVGIFVFTPLAILCKENGALLPFFMLVAELTLFKLETAQPVARRVLIVIFTVCTLLPVLAFVSYVALHPDWLLGGYATREFTLPERLMTEARVVWFYVRLIVLPSIALMGMYHDDIAISHGLFDPVTTLPAIIGMIALPVVVWLARRRQPLVTFGILFFFVGHSMESTIIPLELAHEHRNYLPMLGILLAFFHLLLQPFHLASARIPRQTVAVLLIGLFAAGTFSRATAWANPFDMLYAEIEHHPNSPRANIEMGNLYARLVSQDPLAMEENYLFAWQYYEHEASLNKSNVNGLFGLVVLSMSRGKPIENSLLTDLTDRLKQEVLPNSIIDPLLAIAGCQSKESCPLSSQEVEQLLRAPLKNPHVFGHFKALAYSALTYYLVNVARDYSAAIDAINQSIALAPMEREHRLTLVRLLVALQRPDEARKQLAILKQADHKNSRQRDIALLEKQLTQNN